MKRCVSELYIHIGLKRRVSKLYRHISLKGYYFIYKYQFDVERNLFFFTNSLFTFIRNKTELLNKLIEVLVYKLKTFLYPEDISF